MSDDVVSREELSEINTLQENLSAGRGISLDDGQAFEATDALYVKQCRFALVRHAGCRGRARDSGGKKTVRYGKYAPQN